MFSTKKSVVLNCTLSVKSLDATLYIKYIRCLALEP